MLTHPRRAMRPTNEELDAAQAELIAMGLFPIGGGEQTPEEIAAEEAAAEAARIAEQEKQLTDAGKAALKAEREARKQAVKEVSEVKAELETLLAERAAADEAKRKQAEADAIKKGEYQQLSEEYKLELGTTRDERDALKQQLADVVTVLKPETEAIWKELPSEIKELYAGAGDDILAKRAFIATHKKLIDKLTANAESARNGLKTPITPKPNGALPDDERAALQRSGQYTPM